MKAYGCEQQWQALYGSHLSPDERLFAVTYWRWQREERVRASWRAQQEKHLSHIGLAEQVASYLGLNRNGRPLSPSISELALRGIDTRAELPSFDFGVTAEAAKLVEQLQDNAVVKASRALVETLGPTLGASRALTESVQSTLDISEALVASQPKLTLADVVKHVHLPAVGFPAGLAGAMHLSEVVEQAERIRETFAAGTIHESTFGVAATTESYLKGLVPSGAVPSALELGSVNVAEIVGSWQKRLSWHKCGHSVTRCRARVARVGGAA